MTTNSKFLNDTFGDYFSNISAFAEKEANVVLPFDDTEVAQFIADRLDQCRNQKEIGLFGAMLFFAGLRVKATAEIGAAADSFNCKTAKDRRALMMMLLASPTLRDVLQVAADVAVKGTISDAAKKLLNDK